MLVPKFNPLPRRGKESTFAGVCQRPTITMIEFVCVRTSNRRDWRKKLERASLQVQLAILTSSLQSSRDSSLCRRPEEVSALFKYRRATTARATVGYPHLLKRPSERENHDSISTESVASVAVFQRRRHLLVQASLSLERTPS